MSDNHVQDPQIASAAEFGGYLRRLRKQKGLSLGEVSERLKLPVRQIEALETGNYEKLPEPVFVRGFIRSYASFLDANEEKLNHYLAHFSPPTKVSKASANSSLNYTNTKVKKPFPTWVFGLLGLAIIGVGVYAWQSKSQNETDKQEASSVASEALVVSASNISASNVLIKPMSASEVANASAVNVQAASVAAASTPAVITGELLINTRYRTMLTVTNAQGEILINRIVPSQSEHRFANGAPFDVRIGYAKGSTATFNGKNIDVDAYIKAKTAKFKVDEQVALVATPASAAQ